MRFGIYYLWKKKMSLKMSSAASLLGALTFTTLWANSTCDNDDIFLFFPEHRIWHFMQNFKESVNVVCNKFSWHFNLYRSLG